MVELVEQGEDFAVLKSPASGKLYAVVFEVKRRGEEATVGPLSAFLSKGVAPMTAGAADVPASKPAAATPAGRPAVVTRSRPGQTRAKVERALTGEWQEIKALAQVIGGTGGGVRSTLDILVEEGAVEVKQVPRNPVQPNGLKKNLYRLPSSRPKNPPGVAAGERPSARGDEVMRLLREHGPKTVPELNGLIGRDPQHTGLYSTMRSLVAGELVSLEERVFTDEGGTVRKVNVYQANEPIGPSSQRESEPSHASSNDGL